jgi:predicted nuclease of predicted toxin-antitoxin system
MSEWQFLLDENIDPKVATYLGKEDLFAVHVRDTVGQGTDDEDDVLPYAREHDLIIVTSDVRGLRSTTGRGARWCRSPLR